MKKIFYALLIVLFVALQACSGKDSISIVPPVELPVDSAQASITISLQGDEHTFYLGTSTFFEVQAKKANGDKDDFRIKISDNSVLSSKVNGDTVELIAVKQGEAAVTIRARSNDSVSVSFHVTVIAATSTPVHNAENIDVDTRLQLRFGVTPTLNTAGEIAIYKLDGTQVDLIKLNDAANNSSYTSTKTNFIGKANNNNGGRVRAVSYTPVRVEGNSVIIAPHNGVLEYGTEYYVTISDGAIAQFIGFKANEWVFKTKVRAPEGDAVTVDAAGGADFSTIQSAIDYVAAKGKEAPVTINVKNGVYEEMLFVRNKNNITIIGESRDGVIIHYDNCEALNGGSGAAEVRPSAGGALKSGGRSLFLIEGCDMLRLENLTIKNTHAKIGSSDQAETIYFNSTGRIVAVNCSFISAQDTILVKGYCWFYNCLIAGDVDFIWGYVNICLIENCEIRTRVDVRNGVATSNGGYVMQARVENSASKGFVFLNCNFTGEAGAPDGKTYLARSAGSGVYDNVSVISCTLGKHIATAGWYNNPLPNPGTANATGGWKEYGSKNEDGTASSTTGRLSPGSYQLTENEYIAGYATRAAIFSGYANGTSWMSE
ncbi:MAG: Ig-like domain-containing protein [Prevotellaceae bacterium]|jgi:pectin methylesterase-like acyl-CoA thioesterase|nr:Ig-like domain-containing protein [Prevotellaceae bacterium]